MEEQPGAADLLQPTAAGFLGFLQVLGVRLVWAWLPACIVELKKDTKRVRCGKITVVKKDYHNFQFPNLTCVIYLVEDSQ